jgi:hypothetical protein
MKKKILIGSIFAALLILLVPFNAIAAEQKVISNEIQVEDNEKDVLTLADQLPSFDDPSKLTAEELVRSIHVATDMLRDLGDESTAETINQELASALESEEANANGAGFIWCSMIKLAILAFTALAAKALSKYTETGDENFYWLAWEFTVMAASLRLMYNNFCGGYQEAAASASNELTTTSDETYTTSRCNLCANS